MVLWFREPCHLRFFIRVLMAKGLRRGVPYAGGTASAGRSIPSLHESGRWLFGGLTDTSLCRDKHKPLSRQTQVLVKTDTCVRQSSFTVGWEIK
ncbi:hypothetical protein [Bacteroides heparinolyticus]|uniref:hypothetical protein n=1 Tax=Prevotella heparinolytica TaxID=28113 RepID=UPI0035A0786B